MTILERLSGDRRAQLGRFAKDLMSRDVRDQVKDIRVAAADALDAFQTLAAEVVDRAGDAVEHPAERINHLVAGLERDLPSTDKGRYDRAYGRGWARARTTFVVVGVATGIATGIAGAWLLDPKQGERRREALKSRVRSAAAGVSGQVSRAASLMSERARGLAIERDLIKRHDVPEELATEVAPDEAPLVPVMDPAATGVADVADAGVGAPEDETLAIEADALAGVTDDALAMAADESERGTWHQTI